MFREGGDVIYFTATVVDELNGRFLRVEEDREGEEKKEKGGGGDWIDPLSYDIRVYS